MTFGDVVIECARNREFVAGFERLTQTPALSTTPIESAIDEATGHRHEYCARFCEFVYETVWSRLPPEAFA